jgi:MbtH protein
MTNPFEDESATYLVLINDEGQHALWPTFIEVPRGWTVAHPANSRQACLDYVNQHWTDMRPRSLVNAMAADARKSSDRSIAEVEEVEENELMASANPLQQPAVALAST